MTNPPDLQENRQGLAALDAIEPSENTPNPTERLEKLNASWEACGTRDRDRAEAVRFNKARLKYCAKFGWSHAEFAENWKLRSIPTPNSFRKSEWDLLIDRARKALKAAPRMNADLSVMSDEDKRARKKQQDKEAQRRRRARLAADAAKPSA